MDKTAIFEFVKMTVDHELVIELDFMWITIEPEERSRK
jgi:hypothetical protein